MPAVNNHTTISRTALVVEGGAMRSVFSAGVLDGFLAQSFNPFDLYLGVSGGAINLITYLSGAHGKSLRVFMNYALNKNFIRYWRFIKGGHLIDLDWIFKTTAMELESDIERVLNLNQEFYVCATEVATGRPAYLDTRKINLLQILKASSALPYIYRDFPQINNLAMTDGGVADSIPVAKAINMGAKDIVIIRARPRSYLKKDTIGHRLIRWKLRQHAELVSVMRKRVEQHHQTIRLIRNPPENINITEICPPEDFVIGRLSQNKSKLLNGYESGIKQAARAVHEWLAPGPRDLIYLD